MNAIIEIVQGLGGLVVNLISVYIWVIIIASLLSFVNPDPRNPVIQFLDRVTYPAYRFVRRFMRTDFNGLDIAPLVLIIGLQVIIVVLSALLRNLY